MFEAVGFRSTEDIVAMICIVYSLVYLFLGTGLEGFRNTFTGKAKAEAHYLLEQEERLNKLKEKETQVQEASSKYAA